VAELLPASESEPATAALLAPILTHRRGTALLASELANRELAADQAKLAHRVLSSAGRSDPELFRVLNQFIGFPGEALRYSPEVIKHLAEEVREKGDAQRGRTVFHSRLANCTACHQIDGQGGVRGPDLSSIGTGLSPELIIEAVLWPRRQVKEGYLATQIFTEDGRQFEGYKVSDTATEMTLRDAGTGRNMRIAKENIDEIHEAGSLMPAGLTVGMTSHELRDLIRFLTE